MRTVTLTALRDAQERAHFEFRSLVRSKFPGRDQWDWLRACAAVRGENVRRNDDQTDDVALAADADIRTAHDAYIMALHAFYRRRDGEHGFLGSRTGRAQL